MSSHRGSERASSERNAGPTHPSAGRFGAPATIYVQNGVIVGGPNAGRTYAGQLDGTSGNEVIVGMDARDIVEGGYGADEICGAGGDDPTRSMR